MAWQDYLEQQLHTSSVAVVMQAVEHIVLDDIPDPVMQDQLRQVCRHRKCKWLFSMHA
jgi:hypothetical protein